MKRFVATRVRIYPTPEQEAAFVRISGCCRLVYNLGLEQRRDHWRAYKAATGRGISWYSQKRELSALKGEFAFFKEVPARCLQHALANLHSAYDRFFKGEAGYPRPRKRFDDDRFTFPDPNQIRLEPSRGRLCVPKFMGTGRKGDKGAIRAVFHRKLRGVLRSVTVSRSGTHWYASIVMGMDVCAPRALPVDGNRMVGLDRGVRVPVATSCGLMLGAPIETGRMRERERRLRRALAHCKSGSVGWGKAKRALAAHKAKMARRRADMIHRVSSQLVKSHDWVAIEALRVRSMTASARGTLEAPGRNVRQKAGLNRSVLDKGWGELRRQLVYKLAWKGGGVIEVPAAYSSCECSVCHNVDKASRKGDRFVCSACGHRDHADINAAKIVKYRALLQLGLGPALAGGQVEWQSVEGVVTAAPGELCGGGFASQGISSNGEENGRSAPGKEPVKAVA
jgi:putative transposase